MKTVKAIIVGINNYKNIPGLNGCIDDAKDFAKTLYESFNVQDFCYLYNQNATKENIIGYIKQSAKTATSGCSYVVYFAGHGTQVYTSDSHEEDHLNEALCCYDCGYNSTNGLLIDDEIYQLIKSFPPDVYTEFVFDCCHSGDATRKFNPFIKVVKRSIDLFDTQRSFANKHSFTSNIKKDNYNILDNHILHSACKDNEVSNEVSSVLGARGVFTKAFCEVLREKSNLSRMGINHLVSRKIKRYQHPVLFANDKFSHKKFLEY